MPDIEATGKVVIRDSGAATIDAISGALDLARRQGAPGHSEILLQGGVSGWALVVKWSPELVVGSD